MRDKPLKKPRGRRYQVDLPEHYSGQRPCGCRTRRKWLERDTAKNVMELAGYRQQLHWQGLDTGKDRGMSLGM